MLREGQQSLTVGVGVHTRCDDHPAAVFAAIKGVEARADAGFWVNLAREFCGGNGGAVETACQRHPVEATFVGAGSAKAGGGVGVVDQLHARPQQRNVGVEDAFGTQGDIPHAAGRVGATVYHAAEEEVKAHRGRYVRHLQSVVIRTGSRSLAQHLGCPRLG